jgi:hypothetical protein
MGTRGFHQLPPGWRQPGWFIADPLPQRRADATALLAELHQRQQVTPELAEARLRCQPASAALRERLSAALGRRPRRARRATPALAEARAAAGRIDKRAAQAAVAELRAEGLDPTRLARATGRILTGAPRPGDERLALAGVAALAEADYE